MCECKTSSSIWSSQLYNSSCRSRPSVTDHCTQLLTIVHQLWLLYGSSKHIYMFIAKCYKIVDLQPLFSLKTIKQKGNPSIKCIICATLSPLLAFFSLKSVEYNITIKQKGNPFIFCIVCANLSPLWTQWVCVNCFIIPANIYHIYTFDLTPLITVCPP